MAEFKQLHDKWKAAKKDAKLFYDSWARIVRDVSEAHVDVKQAPAFPAFSKGLGPSLDNIDSAQTKKKPVDAKDKKKAEDAVVQYAKDIAKLHDEVVKIAVSEKAAGGKGKQIKSGLLTDLEKLETVREAIAKALKNLK